MKKIFAFLLIIGLINSCNQNNSSIKNELVSVSFEIKGQDVGLQKRATSTLAEEPQLTDISKVVLSFSDINISENIYERLEIDVLEFAGELITEHVKLPAGDYVITEFFAVNDSNITLFATPLSGSELSYLVEKPLPLSFDVGSGEVNKVMVEVLPILDRTASSFGYNSFQLTLPEVIETYFRFYDDQNERTVSGSLRALISQTRYSDMSIVKGINKVFIPASVDSIQFTFSSDGYEDYTWTYQNDEFSSIQNDTISIVVTGNPVPAKKVALHLDFDERALDVSEYEHEVMAYGNQVYVEGVKGKALKFDGYSTYLTIENDEVFASRSFTISAWVNVYEHFSGFGPNPIFQIPFTSHDQPAYLLNMGIGGYYYLYNNIHGILAFSLADENDQYAVIHTNNDVYPMSEWFNFIVRYNADTELAEILLNGDVIVSATIKRSEMKVDRKIYIGRYGNFDSSLAFTPFMLDDLTFFSTSISDEKVREILSDRD